MAETLAIQWETAQSDALFSTSRELGDEQWTLEFRKA
jgi:hypothetical protein